MEKSKIAILIPTYNNYEFLSSCLRSLMSVDFVAGLFHVYVINNGHKDSCNFIGDHPKITVFNTGKNLGWEGGLKYGLERTEEPFVLFMNDDVYIPQSSSLWLQKMLNLFHKEKVGAVGPSTNVVMGTQNIFMHVPNPISYVNYLIGYCMLVERKSLMEVGGVDESLPGGDDIDLSIRYRKHGYRLICDRSTFIYHHGFKTGERVKGTSDKIGGWNSHEFTEATNTALIKKHGFRAWYETLYARCEDKDEFFNDTEGEMIRGLGITGKTLELGCGATKTVKDAVGVDMIEKGKPIDSLGSLLSVADVVADVSKPLPFTEEFDYVIARHILEHLFDPIETLINWSGVLKKGGKMIIAVPNEDRLRSIPMNFEHKISFTPKSLSSFAGKAGLLVESVLDPNNGVSFILVARKL